VRQIKKTQTHTNKRNATLRNTEDRYVVCSTQKGQSSDFRNHNNAMPKILMDFFTMTLTPTFLAECIEKGIETTRPSRRFPTNSHPIMQTATYYVFWHYYNERIIAITYVISSANGTLFTC
jgi:hypothetical protein